MFQAGLPFLAAKLQQAKRAGCALGHSWQDHSIMKMHIEYIYMAFGLNWELGERWGPDKPMTGNQTSSYAILRQRYISRGHGLLILCHRAMFVKNIHKHLHIFPKMELDSSGGSEIIRHGRVASHHNSLAGWWSINGIYDSIQLNFYYISKEEM